MAEGRLRAIDLYSGAGGWSLGFKMAGIDVVASYEWWAAANKTNSMNTAHPVHTVDIRELPLSELPTNIQVVVGSPPCTEFSYSNRGGGGDINDGLRDIIKFLTVVDYLKPRWWVMENVPRVATIVDKELGPWGRLARFRHLRMTSAVINMEDFGVPQRRKRCLVGNLDFDLLKSYAADIQVGTLGDVVAMLDQDIVCDPLYGLVLPRSDLLDHEPEPFLDAEERRINEAAKTAHPIYNSMPFPDRLDRSVRTITATCTRVSRESVIIEPPGHVDRYRRLSVRERACLQGFPITYQFYASTYGQKLRMIGNAVPPAFSFYVGQAIRQTPKAALHGLTEGIAAFISPSEAPPKTPPENHGRHFPASRTFRFAIPNLRLKSGVRFEMVNIVAEPQTAWGVRFYFGTSKDICEISLGGELSQRLSAALPSSQRGRLEEYLSDLFAFIVKCDVQRMQAVWSHRGPGGTRPFEVLDRIGECGDKVLSLLEEVPESYSKAAINDALESQYGSEIAMLPGVKKLHRYASLIHAGLLIGSVANLAFGESMRRFSREIETIPKGLSKLLNSTAT
jgi:DNA (cytosine-5)-methyltransferase 1